MRISDWSSDVCSSDLMARPEPAHAVRAAVEGIISEIVEEEAKDPRPPPAFERDSDVEQTELIDPHRHADHRRADEGARDLAAGAEHQRRQSITRAVATLVGAQRHGNPEDQQPRTERR